MEATCITSHLFFRCLALFFFCVCVPSPPPPAGDWVAVGWGRILLEKEEGLLLSEPLEWIGDVGEHGRGLFSFTCAHNETFLYQKPFFFFLNLFFFKFNSHSLRILFVWRSEYCADVFGFSPAICGPKLRLIVVSPNVRFNVKNWAG